MPPLKRNAITAVAVVFIIVNAVLQAQKVEKPEPQVTLEDVVIMLSPAKSIEPEGLSPGALCNLKVKVRNRGVTYWSDGKQARIFVAARQYLYALDAKIGEPVATFGDGTRRCSVPM